MDDKKVLLIVDDSQLIRTILVNTLQDEFYVVEASDGLEAIHLIKEYSNRFSAILLDLIMPCMDGFQVLNYMKEAQLTGVIPVIIITAEASELQIARAYDLGADEVIQKPFHHNIIKKRVNNITKLYGQKNHLQELVTKQTKILEEQSLKICQNNDMMIDMLSTVIEYRSLESGQHIRRIRGFTGIILESIADHVPDCHFTKNDIRKITAASALHDIGKIAIPDSILLKPGKLTPSEFDIMKEHTIKGVEILYNLHGIDDQEYLSFCYEICLHHHERWDGNGYPDGLAGDDIPIAAQAVSIADAYDALTHRRVYKDAYSFSLAANMILDGKCGIFSPDLLICFRQSLPEFENLSLTYTDCVY